MTWTDIALTVAFVLAAVGFWAALVAIAVWQEWRDEEGDE
jgi:hypothetical protein